MKIRQFSEVFSRLNSLNPLQTMFISDPNIYKPTPYLSHPFLQSIYDITVPQMQY
jgi:hypothetical protein